MLSDFATLLPVDRLDPLLAMPFAEVWLAAAILGLTASIYATGIPGALLPISFSSGALLGEVLGIASVAAGALIGSLVLYSLLKRGSQAALRQKYSAQLTQLSNVATRSGVLPIVGLRLLGVPHLAVTAVCALASIGLGRYALATIIGTFPAIAFSAIAGSAV